ncbi:MAG: PEGA domain-containing protein [Syntrophobacteraceae bacterium]
MKFGRYEIVRELGRGSMGVVYQAHDPQIDRLVALKVLRQDRVTSEAFVKRFLKEAKAIGRLSHSNIVTVFDVGEDGGAIYIAMEFLEGRPLDELIKGKRFEIAEILTLGIQIADALDYAHGKGVVHRDIKPSNIVVQPKGQVKITDFGIAHMEDPTATLQTQDGEILGTPAYMSPEQILGKAVDGRSDIFSLGVILYELTTGERPFGREGKTLATMFNEIVNSEPPEPSVLNPSVEPGLAKVIKKCLSKSPAERFESGEAVAEELRRCGQENKTAAVQRSVQPPKIKKQSKPQILLLILLLFAIAAGGIYFFLPEEYLSLGWLRSKVTDTGVEDTGKLASLKMESNPSEAEVFVNGESKGKTPLRLDLPLGKHAIRIAANGFGDWADDLELLEPKEYPLRIELKASVKWSSLKIESNPAEADVFVDNKLQGKSPLELNIEAGLHAVRLLLPGYMEWSDQVQLDESKTYPLNVELKPMIVRATLQVQSTPSGAEVFVDGASQGKTPAGVELPLGWHMVRVVLTDHEDWTEEIQLVEAKEYTVSADLKPLVRRAFLQADSEPPGAQLFVDGALKGNTPMTLELPLGKYSVRISISGYEEWEETIPLEQAKEYPIIAKLRQVVKESFLVVESMPSGAGVYVDGRTKGKTPLRLKISPGKHKIRLTLSDYEDWESAVQVEDGKENPLNIEMQQLTKQGLLSINSKPAGAAVFVDGVSKGKTPLQLKINPGRHRVKLTLANYQVWEGAAQVEEGRDTPPLSIEMQQITKQGLLSATSEPSGATVYVDGVSKGKTPLRLKLDLGKHRVKMSVPNYNDWEETIELDEVAEYDINVKMSRTQKSDDWGIGEWKNR